MTSHKPTICTNLFNVQTYDALAKQFVLPEDRLTVARNASEPHTK